MSRQKENAGTWSVYMHTVPAEINGCGFDKYYIGVTSKQPKERWENGKGYRTQAFYNAIIKYGWNNIRHDVVATNMAKNDALDLERLLIFLYKTTDKVHGYNVALGGQGDDMTDDTIAKLSAISKANWENPIYVEKVKSNLKRGADNHKSKKIVLLNTKEVFECEMNAMKKYGVAQSVIGKYCRRKSICEKKDANGNNLVFRWYSDFIKMSEEEIQEEIKHDTMYCNRTKHKKPVVCVNTGEVFDYLFEAQNKYSVNRDSITGCCKGTKRYGGKLESGEKLTWAYLSDYERMTDNEKKQRVSYANTIPKRTAFQRTTVDTYTNKAYKSLEKCIEDAGLTKSTVLKSMKNGDYANGKYRGRFVFLDDYMKDRQIDESTALLMLEFVN